MREPPPEETAPESRRSGPILQVDDLHKEYDGGGHTVHVLRGIGFAVDAGRTAAIVGPSGSGKTTLLGICAGLDTPTSGRVLLDGEDLGRLGEDARATLRNQAVGFVFQNFQLLPTLTALENVMVPLELRGEAVRARRQAAEWLDRVGLGDRTGHYPVELSGGEQQRVALARAFVTEPAVLFADEPTGNLDEETGEEVEDLLFGLNEHSGTTLILVTHDLALARRTGRILRISHGQVEEIS